MGEFIKGDIVVIPFPFSDLSSSKRRPALVVAEASSNELILAQITSQSVKDSYAVEILDTDFSDGGLRIISNIRPNKLFTADSSLIAYKAGRLKQEKIKSVADSIIALISADNPNFFDIKNQIHNPIIRKILAACVFDNSSEGLDKVTFEYLNDSTRLLYGWHENGKIVGVCGFEVHHDCLEILHIAVCEDARSCGIGRLIISALREQYKMNIKAETDDDAVGFYQKCGFITTAFQKYDIQRWSCILNTQEPSS